MEIVIKRFQKKEKDIKMWVCKEGGWIWEDFVGNGKYDRTALPKTLKELMKMNSNKLINDKATKKSFYERSKDLT